jgi:hypothetical protein
LLGERGGTRTLDPMIKSHVLYRLSYALTVQSVTTIQTVIPFQLLSGHDPPETDSRSPDHGPARAV